MAPRKKDEVYEAEKIIGARKVKNKQQYLVKWKDYDESVNSWEPENNILDKTLIEIFRAEEAAKASRLVAAASLPKAKKSSPISQKAAVNGNGTISISSSKKLPRTSTPTRHEKRSTSPAKLTPNGVGNQAAQPAAKRSRGRSASTTDQDQDDLGLSAVSVNIISNNQVETKIVFNNKSYSFVNNL